MADKVVDAGSRFFQKRVIGEVKAIVQDPEFNKRVDEEYAVMPTIEKLSEILSDFGESPRLPHLLNELGYTPDVLVRECGMGEQSLRNLGFTPSKLRELGYKVTDYFTGLNEA